jgi:MFS family permease
MLIIGRAVAGAGAAGIMSGTMSITAAVVTPRLRALYTGVLSSMFGIALICGPLLGGAFTQHLSWRWVFYINLPLGIVTIGALMFFFEPPTRSVESEEALERIKRLDLLGVAMFVPASFMNLLALQWGGIRYPWRSVRIFALFVGGAVMLIVFAFYQSSRGNMAMIPPAVLTERTVLLASLVAMWAMPPQTILGLWLAEWFQVCRLVSW